MIGLLLAVETKSGTVAQAQRKFCQQFIEVLLLASTLQLIDEFVNDIENGSTDLPRFNQQEHSGLYKAGSALIGASVIASYATGSLTAGGHAGSGQKW